jgi:hypothetical protein
LKIYHQSDRPGGMHRMFVAPAAHVQGECPKAWTTDEGEAITMTVTFVNGEAVVPDDLGRYMVANGLAKKTRLIMPIVGL